MASNHPYPTLFGKCGCNCPAGDPGIGEASFGLPVSLSFANLVPGSIPAYVAAFFSPIVGSAIVPKGSYFAKLCNGWNAVNQFPSEPLDQNSEFLIPDNSNFFTPFGGLFVGYLAIQGISLYQGGIFNNTIPPGPITGGNFGLQFPNGLAGFTTDYTDPDDSSKIIGACEGVPFYVINDSVADNVWIVLVATGAGGGDTHESSPAPTFQLYKYNPMLEIDDYSLIGPGDVGSGSPQYILSLTIKNPGKGWWYFPNSAISISGGVATSVIQSVGIGPRSVVNFQFYFSVNPITNVTPTVTLALTDGENNNAPFVIPFSPNLIPFGIEDLGTVHVSGQLYRKIQFFVKNIGNGTTYNLTGTITGVPGPVQDAFYVGQNFAQSEGQPNGSGVISGMTLRGVSAPPAGPTLQWPDTNPSGYTVQIHFQEGVIITNAQGHKIVTQAGKDYGTFTYQIPAG